jgi:hypothetical protein
MTIGTRAIARGVACAAVVVALAGPAAADLVLIQRESGPSPEGGAFRTEKEIALAHDCMRIRDLESGQVVIVRLDKRVVWELSPDGAYYIEIPFDYLETMNRFGEMTEEEILEAQRELASPEEREVLDRRLAEARARRPSGPADSGGAAMPPARPARAPTVAWSGRSARIAGFSAREAVLTVDSVKVAEVWVSSDRFFRDELRSYLEAMASLGQSPGTDSTLAALGGFPLKTTLFAAGDPGAPPLVIETVRAEREPLAPWEFDLPPGAEPAPLLPADDSGGPQR